jgi:hypothetical protein
MTNCTSYLLLFFSFFMHIWFKNKLTPLHFFYQSTIRLIDLRMSINDIYLSNHYKKEKERKKTSLFHILIWLFAKDEDKFTHFVVNFIFFSLSLSANDELRLVILMWCLLMYSCIHIFLRRQSLRKKFLRPPELLYIHIKSWSYHLPIYMNIWSVELCVKLNESIRSFLSY